MGRPKAKGRRHARLPSPSRTLAALDPRALRPLGFSYQKSRAIVEAARAVCEKQLDLDRLNDVPDNEAVGRLKQLRGVGRWTAEYVLLRGLAVGISFPETTWRTQQPGAVGSSCGHRWISRASTASWPAGKATAD